MTKRIGDLAILLDRSCVMCNKKLGDHTADEAAECVDRALRPAVDAQDILSDLRERSRDVDSIEAEDDWKKSPDDASDGQEKVWCDCAYIQVVPNESHQAWDGTIHTVDRCYRPSDDVPSRPHAEGCTGDNDTCRCRDCWCHEVEAVLYPSAADEALDKATHAAAVLIHKHAGGVARTTAWRVMSRLLELGWRPPSDTATTERVTALTPNQAYFARRQVARWLKVKFDFEQITEYKDGEPQKGTWPQLFGPRIRQLEPDADHSGLLYHLLTGGEPLPEPPPLQSAYPVYPPADSNRTESE